MEYAYKAIESAGTALGVKCSDGVILGVEKLVLSKMLVEGSGRRVHAVEEHIGAATAGLNPDGRMLVERGRDEARGYRQNFGEPVPPRVLSDRMGAFMHLFTLYGSYRPVGSSILLAGFDAESKEYELYLAEPTGLAMVRRGGGWAAIFFFFSRARAIDPHGPPLRLPPPPFPLSAPRPQRYFGAAIGKGARAAKTEIEKLKFAGKTCAEALPLVAKILLGVHDALKDKPIAVELAWVCAETGGKYEQVPKARTDAAVAAAKALIQSELDAEDDDEVMEA